MKPERKLRKKDHLMFWFFLVFRWYTIIIGIVIKFPNATLKLRFGGSYIIFSPLIVFQFFFLKTGLYSASLAKLVTSGKVININK